MFSARELQDFYKQGENITQLLREEHGVQHIFWRPAWVKQLPFWG